MFCTTIFFLQVCPVFSHPPTRSIDFLQHNMWTVENGLPMNTVMAITQTQDGYLWVGTEAGLARFDGVRFEIFNHENTPLFSSNLITSLLVDDEGTLWIASWGAGVIRYKNHAFDAITKKEGLLGNEVWTIMESVDDSIWIGSRTGLNRIAGGEISTISLPEELSTRVVNYLLEDRSGRIWVGTNGGGLAWVKKRGEDFESEYIGMGGSKIATIFEDRKGAVWIGTMGNGLVRYWGNNRITFTRKNGLSSNDIRCLFEDRFGNLWIGTYGGGINILAADDDHISVFPNQDEFNSDVILCFYQDREGTLWMGTGGSGLNSLRETKIITYTSKNGLSHNNVYGAFQDSEGRLWTGTKGYGVNYFQNNRFFTLTRWDGLSSDSVVCMAEDGAGSLWFGTLGNGVNRYRGGKFEAFDTRHGLSDNSTRAVYADPDGRIWVGTIDGGIHRFQNGKFTLAADVKFRVNTLLKDSRGDLWAGTFGTGLCRLKDGTVEVFDDRRGLSNNIVCCIHEDKEGTLWIGTAKGFNRFQDGKFSQLYKKDGLPDDTVYWILEDYKEDFWISSNRGIYRLCRQEVAAFFNGRISQVKPSVYGTESGMRSIECNGANQPAGWRSRDGKLWFPTTNGLSVVDPINMGINKIPPPVEIEKIIIDGETYPADQKVVTPPGKNNVEIHYTALSFIVPQKILFKYKMEGYDKQWLGPGNSRTAYYTDLPPGEYRFRVMASNSDGVWNDSGAWIELHLKPKFHQTLVFKILLFLLVGFLIFISYCYIRRNIFIQRVKHKSRNSCLTRDETEKYIRKLLYLIEEEKIYKNSDLSIKSLSSKLLLSPRTLSHIINDRLEMNFYELINEYRIKEAQRILTDPDTEALSILEIAHEVGYNSKSAFNRVFKNYTHMTPSEFKKKHKK
jgi:ligand-binding sensor domain-containing protein/AraC-like DNA-binding protein